MGRASGSSRKGGQRTEDGYEGNYEGGRGQRGEHQILDNCTTAQLKLKSSFYLRHHFHFFSGTCVRYELLASV